MEKLNKDIGIIDDEEELDSNQYLGTFRWKKSFKFPILPSIKPLFYSNQIKNWNDFIEGRLSQNFEIEPHIIDALSFPISVISGLQELKNENKLILSDSQFNIILMGVSQKAEVRIALESNFFDEIFHFINLQKNLYDKTNISEENITLNLYFVGPEVQTSNSYFSKNTQRMKYIFSPLKSGEFLKQNALEFSKTNTVFVGMNCGYGAGYLKLTNSWVDDLIKLLKFNYPMFFTYTNDYEDMKGELGIIRDLLGGKIFKQILSNPFKCMTTYNNEEEGLWSCGNYGIYFVSGYAKDKLLKFTKLDNAKMKNEIKKALEDSGIKIK